MWCGGSMLYRSVCCCHVDILLQPKLNQWGSCRLEELAGTLFCAHTEGMVLVHTLLATHHCALEAIWYPVLAS